MSRKKSENSLGNIIDQESGTRSQTAKSPEAQEFAKGDTPASRTKKPEQTQEQATKRVTVYMTPSEYQAIRKACFDRDEKMSDVMTRLAMEWVKNH